MTAARPQNRPARAGRRAGAAALALASLLVAVGCGQRTVVLGADLATTTTATATTGDEVTPASDTPGRGTGASNDDGTATTDAAGGGTTDATSDGAVDDTTATSATSATSGTAAGRTATTTADSCRIPAGRPTDPTLPGGTVSSSTAIGVRVAHPATWPLTDLTVRADQVVERRMLAELDLAADAPLRPLVVRDPSSMPGLAFFKLPRPAIDLLDTAGVMREFYWSRKFLVQDKPLSACLDGQRAVGLFGTNGDVLQLSWFVYRGDAMYFILGLADDDGSARTQQRVQAEFGAVLDTVRFLD